MKKVEWMGWPGNLHIAVTQGEGTWTSVYFGELIWVFRKGVERWVRQIWNTAVLFFSHIVVTVLMMTQWNPFLDLFCGELRGERSGCCPGCDCRELPAVCAGLSVCFGQRSSAVHC